MAAMTLEEIHEYNEAVLQRIRQLCARRGTNISKIEKTLGYGNGTVSGWTKAKKQAPYDRIVAIAEHLEVPVSALTGAEMPAMPKHDGLSLEDIKAWVGSAEREELLDLMGAIAARLKEM